ncbi:MAG TPA: glycosyltransferase family 4 protein [Burkholderiales bacterium]|nr:glycosyltransferase family 4 protein [Burkholderiales bacterium]
MTPLAIVHTESSLGWGGQEIRILSESQGLIRRGHDVKLLCSPEARIRAEAKTWGVPAIALPIARKRPLGVKVMFEWLKRNRCDVVSTHSSTDSWLAALALLALGRPVRMVRTRHISAPVPRNLFSRWLYTRATARIVTAGESLRRELIERNHFAAERIDSVPTGIDASRFKPGERNTARAALSLPVDRTLVGIVATLRSWKGHRYLVEAVAQLPDSISLVIVGDGPQREALEALVDERNLRARVRFAGDQRDVVPWLQALDIFALPSYANEGVPQALVQAMLVGLPCVTTNAGSIAELATHELTALVVPAQDPGALRDAIDRLAANPDFRKNLGAAARRHCSQHLSYETMLDRMEAIYRQVSGKRG